MTIANFNEYLMIPHQHELMKFFENFHMMKYPKEPILMLKKKCKMVICSFLLLVFIVQYEAEIIHAMDGCGTGIVIVPCMGNFLLKVYKEEVGAKHPNNSFGPIVKAFLEVVNFINKN